MRVKLLEESHPQGKQRETRAERGEKETSRACQDTESNSDPNFKAELGP